MTARPGPGTPGKVVSATDHRRALGALIAPGSATDPLVTRSGIVPAPGNPLRVAQNSPLGMSARVNPGHSEIYRPGRGPYRPYNDALATVNFDPSPAQNSRWDLVYLVQRDSEADGGASTPTLGVLKGEATISPTKPYGSLPAGGIVLAEVGPITTSTTTITDAMITNVAPYTAVRGTPLLVRNQAERDALNTIASATYPITVERLDTGALERNAGTGWVSLVGNTRSWRSLGSSDTAVDVPAGTFRSLCPAPIVIPAAEAQPGTYLLIGTALAFTAAAGGAQAYTRFVVNEAPVGWSRNDVDNRGGAQSHPWSFLHAGGQLTIDLQIYSDVAVSFTPYGSGVVAARLG